MGGMAKKSKPAWWSPRQWVETILPSTRWSSRRQFLMQSGLALLIGWALKDGREVRPRVVVNTVITPGTGGLQVKGHDAIRVATASTTSTTTNTVPVR